MNTIQKIIDIRSSADPARAIRNITDAVSIRGYNMWLLVCSAGLASIGLDTSSSAVIIGAMLISPLMSPILGIGLSFGIHDRSLLGRSIRNLFAAVILSLIASVLYFLVSPFGNPTPEIESRTYPTLLDVMVALFGGIAGIVSASRSGVSTAIPGVAIATALMPPLCTAGYGLAKQQWNYFGGAFYLFFINAAFISLATFLIVKYLRFPEKEFASKRLKNFYSFVFGLIIILVTLPSIYFLYTIYQKELRNKKIQQLVLNPISRNGNEILKWELERKDTATWITVFHSGKPLSDSLQNNIQGKLNAAQLDQYRLKALRVNMTREEVNMMSAEVARQLFQQWQVELAQKESAQSKSDSLSLLQVTKETMIAFPFIDTMHNGWIIVPDSASSIDTIPAVFYRSAEAPSFVQQIRLSQFLKVRFRKDSIAIFRQ
jgi:uncharacterized hydrophobic protein (TIGR00271 family)